MPTDTRDEVEAGFVKTVRLSDQGDLMMRLYGQEINENRAIQELHDGCKPVQRRILMSMFDLRVWSTSPCIKSARIQGDTLGKYHPHGEGSVYQAMVAMTDCSMPYLDPSESNWGDRLYHDPAGAARYTNTRMTLYTQNVFFDPRYVPIMDMMDNYDGENKEPVILPALLPNALINGNSGIGVGLSTDTPGFSIESVCDYLVAVLKSGKKADAIGAIAHLDYAHSIFDGSNRDKDKFHSMIKNGRGSVFYRPVYRTDSVKRSIEVYGFPPNCYIPDGKKELRESKLFSKFVDMTSIEKGNCFQWFLKRGVGFDDAEEAIINAFGTNQRYVMNFTHRSPITKPNGEVGITVSFHMLAPHELLNIWIPWRLDLEKKALQYRKEAVVKSINYSKLMIKAALNLALIKEVLERKHAEPLDTVLAKRMGISEEEAKIILDLSLRRLYVMDADEHKKKIAQFNEELLQIKGWMKDLKGKVVLETERLKKLLIAGKGKNNARKPRKARGSTKA